MFNRSKLRQILTKHQHELQKSYNLKKHKNLKSSNNSSSNSNNNVDDDIAGKSTPIEYFRFNENDFSSVKKKDEPIDYKNMDIFQRAISPLLTLGQCFALLPVMGVHQPNPRRMRFSFKSLQMLVTLVFLLASSIFSLATLKHLTSIGINAKNLVGLVFFLCVQSACLLFLALAPKWPRIMRYWTNIELIFIRKPYEEPQRKLATRIRIAGFLIIAFALVEHGLYLTSAIASYKRKSEICSALHNRTVVFNFDDYLYKNYDYVFEILPFNKAIGISILLINFTCTFIWNFMDLFIMMISKGIAYRFEQITARINKLVDTEIPETIFIEIREHYVKLCELLEYVDENLSGIILLSCMNNLYFVCYQLLNIFNKLRWPINYIYFWFSLLYLIGRTAFVFLTAAAINDESKGALGVLRRVSSKTWCVEVERLIFQMTTQTVALSGKKFYFLTRRLLFGMAGTIVTYELVLLQFDEPNRAKGLPELCT